MGVVVNNAGLFTGVASIAGIIATCTTSPLCSNIYKYSVNYFSGIQSNYKELQKDSSALKQVVSFLAHARPDLFLHVNSSNPADVTEKFHALYLDLEKDKQTIQHQENTFSKINEHSKKIVDSLARQSIYMDAFSLSTVDSHGVIQSLTAFLEQSKNCLETSADCENKRALSNSREKTLEDRLVEKQKEIDLLKSQNLELAKSNAELIVRLRACKQSSMWCSDPGGATKVDL